MSPKISFWLLLRLALLLAAFLAQSGEGASWGTFKRQHIDHPKTRAANNDAYCNLMMQRRGLTRGRCKPTNTFINASQTAVRGVCRRGGGTSATRGLTNSRRSFPMITCRSTGRHPNCAYRATTANRRIRVRCRRGVPIHFDGYA